MRYQQENDIDNSNEEVFESAVLNLQNLKRGHSVAFSQHSLSTSDEYSEDSKDTNRLVFASNGQDAFYARKGFIINKEGLVLDEVLYLHEYNSRAVQKKARVNSRESLYVENFALVLTEADLLPVVRATALANAPEAPAFTTMEPSDSFINQFSSFDRVYNCNTTHMLFFSSNHFLDNFLSKAKVTGIYSLINIVNEPTFDRLVFEICDLDKLIYMLGNLSVYHRGQLMNLLICEQYPAQYYPDFPTLKVDVGQLEKFFKTPENLQSVQDILQEEFHHLKNTFNTRINVFPYMKALCSQKTDSYREDGDNHLCRS
jgi:hypothetical protein